MQIIASNIRNLTDARYFAARGVDYQVFDHRPETGLSLSDISAVSEWVEGPGLCIDLRGKSTGEIEDAVAVLDPAALILDLFASPPPGYRGRVVRCVNQDNLHMLAAPWTDTVLLEGPWPDTRPDLLQELLSQKKGNAQVWVDLRIVEDFLTIAVNDPSIDGLVLYGDDEEATGLKAFGDLDEIFDVLDA